MQATEKPPNEHKAGKKKGEEKNKKRTYEGGQGGGSTKNENENVATAKTDSCNLHICNATRRDSLCAPNDTFSVAARRIVCQHWQDEARGGETRQTKLNQKPQSQKKKKARRVGGGAASEADNKVFFAYAKSAV